MPEAPLLPQSPLRAQVARMALGLAAQLEQQAEQAPLGSVVGACEELLLGQGRQFLRDALAAALQAQIDAAEKRGAGAGPYLRPALPEQGGRLARVPDRAGAGSAAAGLPALPGVPAGRLPRRRPARLRRLADRPRRADDDPGRGVPVVPPRRLAAGGALRLVRLPRGGPPRLLPPGRPAGPGARGRLPGGRAVPPGRGRHGVPGRRHQGQHPDRVARHEAVRVRQAPGRPAGGGRAVGPARRAGPGGPAGVRGGRGGRGVRAALAGLGGPAGAGRGPAERAGRRADWIWDHAEPQFANWQGTLDIYHASEWLAGAAKAACGEGTDQAARWLREARLALLADGYAGVCEYVSTSAAWVPDRAGLEGAAPGLLNYLMGHRDRLSYALRLSRGEPIGSGLIEGACKQMIGRRMKQTGARWDVTNANRMGLLRSLAYADALPLYFTAA